jgi:hypothetical protein
MAKKILDDKLTRCACNKLVLTCLAPLLKNLSICATDLSMTTTWKLPCLVWHMDPNGVVHIARVMSKTRVAPIKRMTISRLQLCGAHLLSQILPRVKEVLDLSHCEVYAWTDSMVVHLCNWAHCATQLLCP